MKRLSPHPLAWRRSKAYLLDCLIYAGVAVAEIPLGLAVHREGWSQNPMLLAGLSSVPPIAATWIAAVGEAGPRRSTWGKRRQGLVVSFGDQASFGRALLRNTVKIFVPWTLGHVVAFGAATGGFDRLDPITLGATAVTYPGLAAFAVMGGFGSGRGPHDRAAGTTVVTTEVAASVPTPAG